MARTKQRPTETCLLKWWIANVSWFHWKDIQTVFSSVFWRGWDRENRVHFLMPFFDIGVCRQCVHRFFVNLSGLNEDRNKTNRRMSNLLKYVFEDWYNLTVICLTISRKNITNCAFLSLVFLNSCKLFIIMEMVNHVLDS